MGLWNATTVAPITKDTIETIVTEEAADLDTMALLPLPLYWATTTVPPVARAINTCIRKMFRESTIFTALMAATP
ncbi:hypothetical protein D3C75_724490 [compost metagenome]